MNKTVFKIVLWAGMTVALLAPAFAGQKAIKVLKVEEAVNWTNVNDAVWAKTPAQEVSLATAPAFHPDAAAIAAGVALKVQAVQDKKNIYLRLSWQDGSANAQIRGLNDFKDAVAVQFPTNKNKATSPFMGEKGKRVNIWRWAAGDTVENLFAEGFGTLTPSETQYLKGIGVYKDGGWSVILSRSLSAPTAGDITFEKKSIPVAFSAWDGGNGERDGFKAVTLEWLDLQF